MAQVFTGALSAPNQQHHSTEGNSNLIPTREKSPDGLILLDPPPNSWQKEDKVPSYQLSNASTTP